MNLQATETMLNRLEVWWFVGLCLVLYCNLTSGDSPEIFSVLYGIVVVAIAFHKGQEFAATIKTFEDLRSVPRWGTLWNRRGNIL
jgi:hypothetical protein